MPLKALAFALAYFLLVMSQVISTEDGQHGQKAYNATVPAMAPAHPPVDAPGPAVPHMPPVSTAECPRLCDGRCKMNSRPRHCKRLCLTCCQRCRCVPPGTAGNREMCGKCYMDMTTHGNRTKCPSNPRSS